MAGLPPTDAIGALEACWRFLVLGVVQGLTEFLPISSTAHLKVVPVALGWGDPGVAVTAVIQLGSTLAVLGFFRDDLLEVFAGMAMAWRRQRWQTPQAQLGLAIVLGTVPIVVAGTAIKAFVPDFDQSPLRSIAAIGVVSIVMALLLAMAEQLGNRRRRLQQVHTRDGWIVGLAQALALVPGVSRSGSTLTAALFTGWNRADAARFSFLLGIPSITLAGLVELREAFTQPAPGGVVPLLVGIFSSALVSWLAIAWLLHFLQRHSTWWFVGYRLFFGVALLLWVAHGRG
jgi:undecaprenyl-diphosphatase